jgi:hypothetical protein
MQDYNDASLLAKEAARVYCVSSLRIVPPRRLHITRPTNRPPTRTGHTLCLTVCT